MKSKKHNIVYKVTNRINGKIYIGVHKTDNLDDGYLGSGRAIKAAVLKYGKDKFTKEVLYEFDTYQEALEKEKEVVDKDFINRPDTYNAAIGGWHWKIEEGTISDRLSQGQRTRFSNPEQRELISNQMNARWRNATYVEKMKNTVYTNSARNNKISAKVKKWISTHPEEHAARMSRINKNPDKIQKTAAAHIGTKRSKRGCENIRAGIAKSLQNPQTTANRSKKGCIKVYNEQHDIVKYIDPLDQVPEGYVLGGRPMKHRREYKSKYVGGFFAYDLVTGESKRFMCGESIPSGWSKGRAPGVYAHDPITQKTKKYPNIDTVPSGWVIGRRKRNG